MFNKLKSLIKQKVQRKSPRRAPRTTTFELVDCTVLLELLPIKSCEVEEIYTRTTPYNVKSISKVLELPTGVANYIRGYGTENQSLIQNELAEGILKEAVLPVIDSFYEEHSGKLVVYSPLDTIRYCNTISRGWYLMFEDGSFTLHCNYRVFKEEV